TMLLRSCGGCSANASRSTAASTDFWTAYISCDSAVTSRLADSFARRSTSSTELRCHSRMARYPNHVSIVTDTHTPAASQPASPSDLGSCQRLIAGAPVRDKTARHPGEAELASPATAPDP